MKFVKLDDVEEGRVLTALEVIYEGGSPPREPFRARARERDQEVLRFFALNAQFRACHYTQLEHWRIIIYLGGRGRSPSITRCYLRHV